MSDQPSRPTEYVTLTPSQREFFDSSGYLVIEDALPQDFVAELDAAIDRVYGREERRGNLQAEGKLNLRNCIVEDDAFFRLLDWPTTVPLAWGILNWNVQLNTSNLIVVPTQSGPAPESPIAYGLHRDGGASHQDMQEPHPRILLKIAYAISDQSDPASGATMLVPGSNRLLGKLPVDPNTGRPVGAIPMNVKAGDAFIFEQRTWHGIGHNWSGTARKTIFMGYAYRWIKPMDYITMPERLTVNCNPIQRQLLGVVDDPMSNYLPTDDDVPLRAFVERAEKARWYEPGT